MEEEEREEFIRKAEHNAWMRVFEANCNASYEINEEKEAMKNATLKAIWDQK